MEVGQKGKHVAIVGYYPDNKTTPFRFELVDLDKERFKDTPAMLDRMREYQHMLESNYDAVMQDLPKSPAPGGDKYAGVESCKDCHKKAYAVWKDTNHAHALRKPDHGREGTKNPISRIHDPECHLLPHDGWDTQQMFRYDSGFYSAEKTPHLKGQQCENCHGPAARHTELETQWKKDAKSVKKDDLDAARHRLHLTVAEAKKTLCYRCHDLDNDPNFSVQDVLRSIGNRSLTPAGTEGIVPDAMATEPPKSIKAFRERRVLEIGWNDGTVAADRRLRRCGRSAPVPAASMS